MWDFLLDIVFPRMCFGCSKLGSYICETCSKTKIDYISPQVCPYCEKESALGLTHSGCKEENGIDGLFVLAHYRKLIPQIIHEIKYQSVYAASSEISSLILTAYHHNFDFDYLVPIPLSKNRERSRGFNQADKLAKVLKLKPSVKLLTRVKDTKPQFDLSFNDRKQNVKNAFSLNPKLVTRSLTNLSFCLVDDVATTGSTLFECARVLKERGAQKVYAITIARGA